MDNIIQIATESMKGCGKNTLTEYNKCGTDNITQDGIIFYCPCCVKVNQAHKKDWEGELIEWEELNICINNAIKYEGLISLRLNVQLNKIKLRISELTQALNILEGGK